MQWKQEKKKESPPLRCWPKGFCLVARGVGAEHNLLWSAATESWCSLAFALLNSFYDLQLGFGKRGVVPQRQGNLKKYIVLLTALKDDK